MTPAGIALPSQTWPRISLADATTPSASRASMGPDWNGNGRAPAFEPTSRVRIVDALKRNLDQMRTAEAVALQAGNFAEAERIGIASRAMERDIAHLPG